MHLSILLEAMECLFEEMLSIVIDLMKGGDICISLKQ